MKTTRRGTWAAALMVALAGTALAAPQRGEHRGNEQTREQKEQAEKAREERAQKERAEKERAEKERAEKARQEREHAEQAEKARQEREKAEQAKQAREHAEQAGDRAQGGPANRTEQHWTKTPDAYKKVVHDLAVERKKHERREAQFERLRQLAREKQDTRRLAQIDSLADKEQARHHDYQERVHALVGGETFQQMMVDLDRLQAKSKRHEAEQKGEHGKTRESREEPGGQRGGERGATGGETTRGRTEQSREGSGQSRERTEETPRTREDG